MACPTAMMTRSAARRTSGLSAGTGAGRPPRTAPMRWGWQMSAVAQPSAFASMLAGARRQRISTPSIMAASTSEGSAVMSSRRRR